MQLLEIQLHRAVKEGGNGRVAGRNVTSGRPLEMFSLTFDTGAYAQLQLLLSGF
jgi:hypothetical protein